MNFFEMDIKYPEGRGSITPENMREYLDDLFSAYENDGFEDTYADYYGAEPDLDGEPIEVIGRVPLIEDDPNGEDVSFLPLWKVRFRNGAILNCYPEEICSCER